MSQPIPSKTIEKAITKGAKKVLAESGISPSTRSGNKELSHLVTTLSKHPFETVQAAQQYGESLGQKIVECSRQANKQHLDGGVIRLLRSQKNSFSLGNLPKPTPQPTVSAKEPSQLVAKSSAPSANAQAVVQSEEPENVIPAAEPVTSEPLDTQAIEGADEKLEVVPDETELIRATLTEVEEDEEEIEDEDEEIDDEEIDEEDEEIDEDDEEIDDEDEEEDASGSVAVNDDDAEQENEPESLIETEATSNLSNLVEVEEPEEVNV